MFLATRKPASPCSISQLADEAFDSVFFVWAEVGRFLKGTSRRADG